MVVIRSETIGHVVYISDPWQSEHGSMWWPQGSHYGIPNMLRLITLITSLSEK